MPESEKPAFMTKEKLDLLFKTLREYQEKTGVVITSFSLKTPVILMGIIQSIDLTISLEVNY